jgi:hypothetical protein
MPKSFVYFGSLLKGIINMIEYMLMYFFRFCLFEFFKFFLCSVSGKDIRVFSLKSSSLHPIFGPLFTPPICVLTLQNLINKHIVDLENEKIKNKKINLQDVKLTQIKCQNLFVSTTDRL